MNHPIKGASLDQLRKRMFAKRMAAYNNLLKAHDWSYEYSEDQDVWRRGRAERQELELRARDLDPGFKLWNLHAPSDYKR